MPRLLTSALLVVSALASAHTAGHVMARAPPRFTVDLDAPAGARWRGAVSAVLAVHPWQWSFGATFAAHNATLFDNLTPAQYIALGAAVTSHFPEQAAELRTISAEFLELGQYVSFEYLCAWVWFHELDHTDLANASAVTAAAAVSASLAPAPASSTAPRETHHECTAIVAQAADGAIVHGRK